MKRFDRSKPVPEHWRLYNLWLYLLMLGSLFIYALMWLPLWLWYTLISLHPVKSFENAKWYLSIRFVSVAIQTSHSTIMNKLYWVNEDLYEKYREILTKYGETNKRDMEQLKEMTTLFTESGDEIFGSNTYDACVTHLDKYDEYIQRVKKEFKSR